MAIAPFYYIRKLRHDIERSIQYIKDIILHPGGDICRFEIIDVTDIYFLPGITEESVSL